MTLRADAEVAHLGPWGLRKSGVMTRVGLGPQVELPAWTSDTSVCPGESPSIPRACLVDPSLHPEKLFVTDGFRCFSSVCDTKSTILQSSFTECGVCLLHARQQP